MCEWFRRTFRPTHDDIINQTNEKLENLASSPYPGSNLSIQGTVERPIAIAAYLEHQIQSQRLLIPVLGSVITVLVAILTASSGLKESSGWLLVAVIVSVAVLSGMSIALLAAGRSGAAAVAVLHRRIEVSESR